MMILNARGAGVRRLMRGALSLLIVAVGIVGVAATPAQASEAATTYTISGSHYTSGVERSEVYGEFIAVPGGASTDTVTPTDLYVYDRSADGYRARLWFNIYVCHCTDATYRVRALHYDNTKGANTYTYHDGFLDGYSGGYGTKYTVEIKIGRYDGNTGRYDSTTLPLRYLTL